MTDSLDYNEQMTQYIITITTGGVAFLNAVFGAALFYLTYKIKREMSSNKKPNEDVEKPEIEKVVEKPEDFKTVGEAVKPPEDDDDDYPSTDEEIQVSIRGRTTVELSPEAAMSDAEIIDEVKKQVETDINRKLEQHLNNHKLKPQTTRFQ